MAMSRRSQLMYDQLRNLFVATKIARRDRNDFRDNYTTILAEKEAVFQALQDERDDTLTRLNARLVSEGEPEITLDVFKDLP